jgi:hypothetical protein
MDILKVHPTAYQKVLKVGIIGPRTFGLGGHDIENPIRKILRDEIVAYLISQQQLGQTVLGITGLDIGAEQDFAIACLTSNIDFTCYVSYTDHEHVFETIPDVRGLYDKLYNSAISRIILSDGDYSPKKTLAKSRRVIHDADCVIYVKNPLKHQPCSLLQLAYELEKEIVFIEPKVNLIDV